MRPLAPEIGSSVPVELGAGQSRSLVRIEEIVAEQLLLVIMCLSSVPG